MLYRAVSLAALRRGIDAEDSPHLAEVARELDVTVLRPRPDEARMYTVLLGGADATDELRSPEVEAIVSEVSAHPDVRAALLGRQREIARSRPSVLVGRDIGTTVLPDAELKVYLDASIEERARRRHRDRLAKDPAFPYDRVVEELRHRDRLDTERAAAPLRAAEDAVVIDTDAKDVDAVLREIEAVLVDTAPLPR